MEKIIIEINTSSNVDMFEAGVIEYIKDPSFKINRIGYKVESEIAIIELDPEKDKEKYESFVEMLINPEIVKVAYNADFIRLCFQNVLNKDLPEAQWISIKKQATMLGLPDNFTELREALELDIVNKSTEHILMFKIYHELEIYGKIKNIVLKVKEEIAENSTEEITETTEVEEIKDSLEGVEAKKIEIENQIDGVEEAVDKDDWRKKLTYKTKTDKDSGKKLKY